MTKKNLKLLVLLLLLTISFNVNALTDSGVLKKGKILYWDGTKINLYDTSVINASYPYFSYKYSDTRAFVCVSGIDIYPAIGSTCNISENGTNSIAQAYIINELTGVGGVSSFLEDDMETYYWLDLSTMYYEGTYRPSEGTPFMQNIYRTKILKNGKTMEVTHNEAREYQNKYSDPKYSKDVEIQLSSSNLEFTYNEDGYFYSQKVYIEDKNGNIDIMDPVRIDNNNFELVDQIDENGHYFQVKILKNKITNTLQKVTISLSGSYEYYNAEFFDCPGSYQDMYSTNTIKISETGTATISGEIGFTSLIIKKVDESGNLLPGAIIKIASEDGTYSKEITTTNKEIVLQDLKYGKYIIKEISSPEGYVVETSNYTVSINQNNLSQTIIIKNISTKVEFSKTDENGNFLSGAVLQIQDKEGNVLKDKNGNSYEWTTTNEAYIITGLLPGNYYLTEISAPEGYVLNSKKEEFIVDGKEKLVKVQMTNKLNKVKISKIDIASKQELPGAILEIQDKEGNIVKLCTDKEGNKNTECKWESTDKAYEIEGMPAGTYYLVEILAPKGFVLNTEKVEFVVDEKTPVIEVIMENKLNKVKISKISVTTKQELPGAMLEIQDKEGNIVKLCIDKEGNKNTECKWESTDKSYEIEGMPKGTYYLVETIAPKGYVLNTEKIEFIVTETDSIVEVQMKNELEVEVPNTLSSRSSLLIAVAMFNIALGIGIVTYVKKNKVEE